MKIGQHIAKFMGKSRVPAFFDSRGSFKKSLLCTAHGSVAKVCRRGGHIYISSVKFLREVVYQKLLKSVDFSRSYSKNINGV